MRVRNARTKESYNRKIEREKEGDRENLMEQKQRILNVTKSTMS